MSNQQAVEWLIDEMNNIKGSSISMNGSVQFLEKELNNLFNQAKAMEKEQREKDLESGFHVGRLYQGREGDTTLEQLKERTFKSESFCNCPKGKGIDFDENQKAYCIDCGKNINL